MKKALDVFYVILAVIGGLWLSVQVLLWGVLPWQPVQDFLQRHKNYTLVRQEKLYPHKVRGEGHFAALLQKEGGERADFAPAPPSKLGEREKLYRSFESRFLNVRFKNLYLAGEVLYSLPQGIPVSRLQTLRAGVRLGEFVKGRFEPSHSLAMCLKEGQAAFFNVDEATAKTYLGGSTFECGGSGWAVCAYKGFPLGWVKISGGVAVSDCGDYSHGGVHGIYEAASDADEHAAGYF